MIIHSKLPILHLLLFMSGCGFFAPKLLGAEVKDALFDDDISVDQQAIRDFHSIEQFFFQGTGFNIDQKRPPERVFYGSDKFGYFESKSFRIKADRVLIDLTPPYYSTSVSFWVEDHQHKRYKLGEQTFKPQYPAVLMNNIKVGISGKPFSSPFFLISGFYRREDFSGRTYNLQKDGEKIFVQSRKAYGLIVFLNRYGEIIMAMNPQSKGRLATGTFMTKPIEGGFGAIFKRNDSRFVALDYEGKPFIETPPNLASTEFLIHHDFILNQASQTLIVPSSRLIRPANSSQDAVIDDIIEFSLKDPQKSKTLFKLSDHFDLTKENPIMGHKVESYYLGAELPRASVDFTHVNLVEEIDPDHLMIGFRNLSKIVLFNHRSQKVIWSIGRSPQDTFQNTGPSSFIHAHTPILRDGHTLTLLDNGVAEKLSRVVSYDLDYVQKKLKVNWMYYPSTKFYSSERSSVTYLKNGNILVFFTMPTQPNKTPYPPKDYIYEYDPQNRQEVGNMELIYKATSHTIRAYPLDSFNRDIYQGLEWRPESTSH